MEVPYFDEIIGQIKINFRLSGMPFDDPRFSFKFFIPFMLLGIVFVEEFAFFCSEISTTSFLELTQLAPCTANGILSLIKIILIFYKKNKIFKLASSLERHYNALRNSENIVYVKDYVVYIKILIKYYFILNVTLISIYNFSSPLFMLYELVTQREVQFHLPYLVLLPIPMDCWLNWFIIYFHLIIGGFICTLYTTTVDCLYYILTSLVCMNFTVLSSQLENYKGDHDILNDHVEQHQKILNLSEDLEDIFTGPNFYNVLVGSVLICVLGFNLANGDWSHIPGCLIFLSSVLLQMLLMSVFGEYLSRESEKVGNAVYLCKWYEMDLKTRKTIMIIQERALRTQKLTGYKFSEISYRSFSKIISSSWSYFTILSTVYEPDA